MIRNICIFCLAVFIASSCVEPNTQNDGNNYDREAMITQWVDEIIVPDFNTYVSALNTLKLALAQLSNTATIEALSELRASYVKAYTSWQRISMFEIGQAKVIGLRNYSNIYPTNTSAIDEQIQSGDYNLALPSTFASQGFPALDYLLFSSENDDDALAKLTEENYLSYVTDLVDRLQALGTEASDSWDAEYRQELISQSDAANQMVNDFLFYYEKFLRAGKVGIPAGVFSGDPLSDLVEAPYSGIHSKDFLLEALDAVETFFNANSSLSSYLAFMNKADVATEINEYWDNARALILDLDPNLRQQVITDNSKMLEVYDELQKAVVLLKVDMLQALSIQVDYVDADGD